MTSAILGFAIGLAVWGYEMSSSGQVPGDVNHDDVLVPAQQ
jgi:hypothetical protein